MTDSEILETIRRHHLDRATALSVKVKYAESRDHIRLATWAHEIQQHNQFASNLERIIGRLNK